MSKPLCTIALLFMAVTASFAQLAIKGKVVDATTNQPIQGVTISNTDKSGATLSDYNGNYTVTVNTKQDSLYFASLGYEAKAIVANNDHMIVFLMPAFGNLNEIVVTAGREAQKRTEVPAAINVISKTTINDTKATRLDMLLNKVPGVFMVDLGNEQHSMSVRQPLGYANLFLYLEDGIPIRTVGDFNHNALIEINQASMERIEVVKGPASSLYGSEAVGGAINFITQTPSPFFSGKVQAELGSRGYKRTDFSTSDTYKKLGVFVGGYFAKQDQPVNEHNNFSKAAVTFRADYRFNDKLKLTTVADYINYKTDQKGGLDSAHFYNKDYSSFYRFTYRKVDAIRIKTTLNKQWNTNNKTDLSLFYRNTSIGQNPFYYISNIEGNLSQAKGQVNKDAFQSYGAVLQHTTQLNIVNAKIVSGVSIDASPATYDARFINIDRDANNVYYAYQLSDSLLTNYSVHLFNTAAFTQIEYEPTEQLKLVAALRYDRLNYNFNNRLNADAYTGAQDASNHFAHLTPKLGITYAFSKDKGIYANYSVGFAPPNITDLFTGVKVPFLKAASYNNYEVGGWLAFAANKGYAEVSLYSLQGNNEIVNVRLQDGSYINQNAGKTSHKGVELNVKYAPVQDVMLRISGSYAKHKYVNYIEQGKTYSGNTMPQAPPFIYNAELTYKPHYCKGFRIALELQGMSKYFTDPQNTATYNGFTVFNARAGYTFNHFELWANCVNVTDKIFATTVEKSAYGVSYRPGQLRTFNVGIAYNFKKQ